MTVVAEGQVWKKDGKYFKVKHKDSGLWKVAPVERAGRFWVRIASDIAWKLEDFQHATLYESLEEVSEETRKELLLALSARDSESIYRFALQRSADIKAGRR